MSLSLHVSTPSAHESYMKDGQHAKAIPFMENWLKIQQEDAGHNDALLLTPMDAMGQW
jgi:hypothetical protein